MGRLFRLGAYLSTGRLIGHLR